MKTLISFIVLSNLIFTVTCSGYSGNSGIYGGSSLGKIGGGGFLKQRGSFGGHSGGGKIFLGNGDEDNGGIDEGGIKTVLLAVPIIKATGANGRAGVRSLVSDGYGRGQTIFGKNNIGRGYGSGDRKFGSGSFANGRDFHGNLFGVRGVAGYGGIGGGQTGLKLSDYGANGDYAGDFRSGIKSKGGFIGGFDDSFGSKSNVYENKFGFDGNGKGNFGNYENKYGGEFDKFTSDRGKALGGNVFGLEHGNNGNGKGGFSGSFVGSGNAHGGEIFSDSGKGNFGVGEFGKDFDGNGDGKNSLVRNKYNIGNLGSIGKDGFGVGNGYNGENFGNSDKGGSVYNGGSFGGSSKSGFGGGNGYNGGSFGISDKDGFSGGSRNGPTAFGLSVVKLGEIQASSITPGNVFGHGDNRRGVKIPSSIAKGFGSTAATESGHLVGSGLVKGFKYKPESDAFDSLSAKVADGFPEAGRKPSWKY